jgi:predicted HTH domain antitoxin
MMELQEKLKDRLIHNYKYSKEETRKLCVADINELIPN